MKRVTKSRIEVIACYTILFFMLYVFYGLARNRSVLTFPISIAAFVISFMISIILYFVSLSVSMRKENIMFKDFNQMIQEQGYCPECIRLLDDLLVRTKSPVKRNIILMQMVITYLCLGDQQKTLDALNQIDLHAYMALPKATSTQYLLAEYYRIHFCVYYELEMYNQAKEAYQKGKTYFSTYDKEDQNALMMIAFYEAMHHNFDRSFQYIEAIPNQDSDDLKFMVESAKADIYQMMKDYDKAEQGYKTLLPKCKYPYQRALIEREIVKVNTSKRFDEA